MPPSTEQRLAELEALSKMDARTSKRLEGRLDKIDGTLQGIVIQLQATKLSGKALIGVVLAAGAVIGWALTIWNQTKGT